MPIRPELRHLYRGPEYEARRSRIAARASHRCEFCHKPDTGRIETFSGFTDLLNGKRDYWMFWRGAGGWHDRFGQAVTMTGKVAARIIKAGCQMAHLDHNPRNDSDDNLKYLCGYCHLNYDKAKHEETRCLRKDGARLVLLEAS